jgi:hypothetical protein
MVDKNEKEWDIDLPVYRELKKIKEVQKDHEERIKDLEEKMGD